MLNMFKKSKTYDRVEELYMTASDAGFLPDRKTAVVDATKTLGYMNQVMVFRVGNVSDVRMGYTPVAGWVTKEVLKNPETKVDGFVVCLPA